MRFVVGRAKEGCGYLGHVGIPVRSSWAKVYDELCSPRSPPYSNSGTAISNTSGPTGWSSSTQEMKMTTAPQRTRWL